MLRKLYSISNAATDAMWTLVIPRFRYSQAVIRKVTATGNDAGAVLDIYAANPQFKTDARNGGAASGDASIDVGVDTEGGDALAGHTITNSDFIMVNDPVGGRWQLHAISSVSTNSGETYLTVSPTFWNDQADWGNDIPEGAGVYIVRAGDVPDSLAVGSATVERTNYYAGEVAAPLGFKLDPGAAAASHLALLAEFSDGQIDTTE